MEQIELFTVDLTRIDGSGEFRCPKCGIEISPDDKTDEAYTILETVTKRGSLEKIILQCSKCRCRIQLVGFQVLNDVR